MGLSLGIAGIIVFLSFISVYMAMIAVKKEAAALTKTNAQGKMAGSMVDENGLNHSTNQRPKDNYSQNFV
ncbi:hypothetical protein KRP22_014897 [Phytophthora ramorum]|nr:hypothetical protein KRP23_11870 [Phytophthora ramorum]KAH7496154.1 hypothetical protein KRP22_14048 [Phytophthora ramorum]